MFPFIFAAGAAGSSAFLQELGLSCWRRLFSRSLFAFYQRGERNSGNANRVCLVRLCCGLSRHRVHIFPVPSGHSESGCQFPGEVKMKRKHVIYGLVGVVIAVALFVVYYLYLGSTAPIGQQPMVRLDNSNMDSLKKSFNESADSVRVIVMLSPT